MGDFITALFIFMLSKTRRRACKFVLVETFMKELNENNELFCTVNLWRYRKLNPVK